LLICRLLVGILISIVLVAVLLGPNAEVVLSAADLVLDVNILHAGLDTLRIQGHCLLTLDDRTGWVLVCLRDKQIEVLDE